MSLTFRYFTCLLDKGHITFSIIGYFYVRSRGKGKFAKRFIPVAKNSAMPDVSEVAETKIPAKKEDTTE